MGTTHDEAAGPRRRSLLQAAVGGSAAAAAAGATSLTGQAAAASATSAGTAAAAAARSGGRFDGERPRFALAVLPDTQYLFDADSADPDPMRATFRYLVAERAEANIAFMTHLGDVTEHGTEHEIELAADTFRELDGKVPYSVLAGNHDVSGADDQRGDSAYLRAFGPDRYARMSTFGGASPDGYNSFHTLRAAGRDWLVLALDWRVSDSGLRWARGVLDDHPTLPAVLTTHDLAWAEDDGEARLSDNGRRLWDGLIRGNDQIFLALGGHYWPPGRTVLTNDAGNDVHVHITNYQDRYYGGAAMIRLYAFDLARGAVDVETFAPWFLTRDPERRTPLEAENVELTGPADRFSLEIDFAPRFAGFSPIPAPEPRPASAVLVRGTVAYWRFDQAGLPDADAGAGGDEGDDGAPVADGRVVRDLSGHGNDLTARRLHTSGDGALTWSTEHHLGQPAHASLRFDGGQGPDRGAVLSTRSDTPLNSTKFTMFSPGSLGFRGREDGIAGPGGAERRRVATLSGRDCER
ncbi:metallophosphoesterase [Streptomyces mayteni]